MTDETPETECRTIGEYLLYKLDRTIAIVGVVLIAMVALWKGLDPNIATAAIGGLVGYVGGRSGK